MLKLRSLNKDDDAMFFFLPLTVAFGFVAVLYILQAFGYNLGLLMEPIFQVYIVIMGVVVTGCLYIKQIFLMLFIILLSLIIVVGYYALYLM